jgi:hypothetical protein
MKKINEFGCEYYVNDEIHFSYDESGHVTVTGKVVLATYLVIDKALMISEIPNDYHQQEIISQSIKNSSIKPCDHNTLYYDDYADGTMITRVVQLHHKSHTSNDIFKGRGLFVETDCAKLWMHDEADLCLLRYMTPWTFEEVRGYPFVHKTSAGTLVKFQYRKENCNIAFRDGSPTKGKYQKANATVNLDFYMLLRTEPFWLDVIGTFDECLETVLCLGERNPYIK